MKYLFVIIRPAPMQGEAFNANKLGMPLGPLYLAEQLLREGWDVKIVDGLQGDDAAGIKDAIKQKPLAVGLSTMSGTQLKNAIGIAKILRSLSNLPIIWGGVHVTHLPQQSLKSDLVDYIVWGEGEHILPKLLDCIKDGIEPGPIPGVGFINKSGEPILGKNSGYTSLNRKFSLPYHLVDMPRYSRKLSIGATKEYKIWTSRGCPFKCSFCSNSSAIWPNTKVRLHSIENIVADVKKLHHEYGADMITFADENFVLNEKRLLNILESLARAGINCRYRFVARIDRLLMLSQTALEGMKALGVVHIGIAPESGSQKILDAMHKGITVEQIYKSNELLDKYGFYKSFNFLVATPNETVDDLNKTLHLICYLAKTSRKSPYPFGALCKYVPLPATEMFNLAVTKGFREPQSLEGWTKFDFSDVAVTADQVRPWISGRYAQHLHKAIALVEELNYLFTGEGRDDAAIDAKIHAVEKLAGRQEEAF